MGTLGLLVREIAELDNKVKDGFNEWVEPIGELIKWTGSEEAGTAEAGTCNITKESSFLFTSSKRHLLTLPTLKSQYSNLPALSSKLYSKYSQAHHKIKKLVM